MGGRGGTQRGEQRDARGGIFVYCASRCCRRSYISTKHCPGTGDMEMIKILQFFQSWKSVLSVNVKENKYILLPS